MNQVQDSTQDPKSPKSLHEAEVALANQVLKTEAQAILNIKLTPAFHEAVELIINRTGHGDAESAPNTPSNPHGSLVVSGLGKSGLIAAKISATFASTGTPAHYLHPSDAMHGDLGRIRRHDVVLLLSYGGSTEEVINLATLLKQDSVPTIALVGKPDSDLAKVASVVVLVGDVTEACPLNLAPTASTTAMLALGDALAMCVSQRRDFGVEDFKKFHPGGTLGKQLMPVTEAMRFRVGETLSLTPMNLTVRQAYAKAEKDIPSVRKAGALLIVNTQGKLAGIFTDADFKRLSLRSDDAMNQPVGDVMTKNPRHLTNESRVKDAVHMVQSFRIDEIPVVDVQGFPLGLIDVQDLIALKVIEG